MAEEAGEAGPPPEESPKVFDQQSEKRRSSTTEMSSLRSCMTSHVCTLHLWNMGLNNLKSKLPRPYSDSPAAIKSACCYLVVLQIALLISGLATFGNSVDKCRKIQYATFSMGRGMDCIVQEPLSDEFSVDNSGYWDTKNHFAPADSMVKAVFHEYGDPITAWRGEESDSVDRQVGGHSKKFYNILKNWNEKYENWGTARTLVSMVVSSETVPNSGSSIEAQISADPKTLMQAEHVRVQSGSIKYPGFLHEETLYYLGTTYPRMWDYSDEDFFYEDYNTDFFALHITEEKFERYSWLLFDDDRSDDDDVLTGKNSKTFPIWHDDWEWPTPNPTKFKPTAYPTLKPPTPKPTMSFPTPRPTTATEPTSKPSVAAGWNLKDDDYNPYSSYSYSFSGDAGDYKEFMVNKYSLWVAAAVNMQVLSVSDLVELDNTEYEEGSRDDDISRRRLQNSRKSQRGMQGQYDGPVSKKKTIEEEERRSAASRKLNMHSGSAADQGKSFAYPATLKPMVLRKFEEKMDPVLCSPANETKGSFCWLQLSRGDDDSSIMGVYFFPLIQHYNPDCLKCPNYESSTEQASFDEKCNTFDMEFLLLFDAFYPEKPYYANYNRTDHYHYDIVTQSKKGMTASGFTGYISINLFNNGYNSHHTFLNDVHYMLPDTQCTTPIAMAADSSSNTQACGTKYATKMIDESKKNARAKYCWELPKHPVYACTPTGWSCFTRGLAESFSFIQFLNAIAIMILVACLQTFGIRGDDSISLSKNQI